METILNGNVLIVKLRFIRNTPVIDYFQDKTEPPL